MFGLDDSRVCRITRHLEPSVMAIQKCRKLSKEDIEKLIIAAPEQAVERPKRRQKLYDSGKKKCDTLKTELRVHPVGRIVYVSQSHPGSVHDCTLFKENAPLPKDFRAYGDSGCQGIDIIHQNADFPYKASKNKPLEAEEKDYNTALSGFRVVVEHIFGDIKAFKIMLDRYRNKRKRYNLKLNLISSQES